jgi:hypothetical protein
MSYQPVRGFFELLTRNVLTAHNVLEEHVYFHNFGETPTPANVNYAVVSLSFVDTIEDVIGCEGMERLRGTLLCSVYTPKDKGPRTGEDICLEVVKEWNQLNIRSHATPKPTPGVKNPTAHNISGPTAIAPDQRPHYVTTVSCSWAATAA